jgi:hypothetical protein
MAPNARVVVLVDADEGEVLEAPDGDEVCVIPWKKLANDPAVHPRAVEELEEALLGGDLDRAVRILRMLTAEPEDGQDPREMGVRS